MKNSGMDFYRIFNFGGTIGVNSLSLSDLIMGNFLGLIAILGLFGIIGFIFPIIMLLVYAFLLITNWESDQSGRIICNILSIISYIYFMVDYHFGFIGWRIFHSLFGGEFVDKLCYINTGIFILNILLMFFGNKIFEKSGGFLIRLVAYCIILFLSNKVLVPIGKSLVSSMISQHIPKPGELMLDKDKEIFGEPKNEDVDSSKSIDEDSEDNRDTYIYVAPELNDRLNNDSDVEPDVVYDGNYGC